MRLPFPPFICEVPLPFPVCGPLKRVSNRIDSLLSRTLAAGIVPAIVYLERAGVQQLQRLSRLSIYYAVEFAIFSRRGWFYLLLVLGGPRVCQEHAAKARGGTERGGGNERYSTMMAGTVAFRGFTDTLSPCFTVIHIQTTFPYTCPSYSE